MKLCSKCSKELPDDAPMCPYCMTKFEATETIKSEGKMSTKNKKAVLIVLPILILIIATVTTVFLMKNKSSDDVNGPNETTVTSVNKSGIEFDGSVISFANMKIDNPELKLTDGQKNVVKYFDNDYFIVNKYENLQKYPKIFREAQIYIYGTVTKILKADDSTYECLVEVFRAEEGDGIHSVYDSTDDFVVIYGNQPADGRITEGDELDIYGRYKDVQQFEIDGKSNYYPYISVNYTMPFLKSKDNNKFNLSQINEIAKVVFGNNIKIKEPVFEEDFILDNLHTPEYFFYIVTLDNQSNSNFKSFEFSRNEGFIRDCNSTESVERTINIAADFEHYIITVFDKNTHMVYLEYYDKDLNKLWSREFTETDNIAMDYTQDNIYLVADNDLYILNTSDGKDSSPSIMVGEKIKVNVIEDGIILIGTGNKDNIMKLDKKGNITWKVSADINVKYCKMIQNINDSVVVNLETEYDDNFNLTNKFVCVDNNGEITSQFIDQEYRNGELVLDE